jgi:hypothetical protein
MVKEKRVISGSTPRGFKIENKHVVLDDTSVPLVKDMFSKFIDLRSMKATSRYIYDQYGVYIDVRSLKSMLQNRWYIGEAYGIKDWCPRIVDDETFNLANNIVDVRAARYDGTRSDRTYLFTGLIFCGCCGRRMTTYTCSNTRQDGSKAIYIYYRCPERTMKQCEMEKQVNQEKLEKWMLDNLITEAERHNIELEHNGKRVPKRSIDRAKVVSKIEKLKDLYLSDLITRDMYEKDYLMLSTLLAEADRQEQQAEKKPLDLKQYKDLLAAYNKLDPPHQKAFWSRVLNKVIVTTSGDYIVSLNQL